jgi:hypothetical protein
MPVPISIRYTCIKAVGPLRLRKGEDTNFYLKKGCKFIAFEASPDLVQLCKIRFEDQIAALPAGKA